MSYTGVVGKVSLVVEIDRQVYFVNLLKDTEYTLVKLASGLCEGGTLNVVKAPDSFKFMSVKEILSD